MRRAHITLQNGESATVQIQEEAKLKCLQASALEENQCSYIGGILLVPDRSKSSLQERVPSLDLRNSQELNK